MIIYIVILNECPARDKEMRIFVNIARALAYQKILQDKYQKDVCIIRSKLDECILATNLNNLDNSNVYVEENVQSNIEDTHDNSEDNHNNSEDNHDNSDNEDKNITVAVLGHSSSGKTAMLTRIMGKNIRKKQICALPPGSNYYEGTEEYISISTTKNTIYNHDTSKIIRWKSYSNSREVMELDFLSDGINIKFIDTPGSENLIDERMEAINKCHMAIIVVDIKNNIEAQTRELVNILSNKKIPFFIVLNKMDSIHNWNSKIKSDSDNIIEIVRDENKFAYKKIKEHIYNTIFNLDELHIECVPHYELEENEDINIMDVTPVIAISSFKPHGISLIPHWVGLYHKRLIEQKKLNARITIKEISF